MGNLFSLLLGTESDAALEVFLSLRRTSNQREALQVAAEYALSGEELTAFEALMIVYKSLETQRNDLAHGCFGVLTIRHCIDVHVHFQSEVLSKESKGEFAADRHARLKENLYVYRPTDLQSLYEDMEQFGGRFSTSMAIFANQQMRDAPQNSSGFVSNIAAGASSASHSASTAFLLRILIGAVLAFRYCDARAAGTVSQSEWFAESFNILCLMPHPENLIDPLVGGTHGWGLLESLACDVV
jgi:hypothetical protein